MRPTAPSSSPSTGSRGRRAIPRGSADAIAAEGERLLDFLRPDAAARRVRFVPEL
jgi:hypothetical protein